MGGQLRGGWGWEGLSDDLAFHTSGIGVEIVKDVIIWFSDKDRL